MARNKIRIGDLLVSKKVISEAQLQTALAEQKSTGRKLGNVFIDMGMVSEDKMLSLLAEKLDTPYVDLRRYNFVPEIVRKLPESHARRYRSIVLDDKGHEYLVGMADPTDIYAYDKLSSILQKPIQLAIIRESDLIKTIDMVYRRSEEINSFAEELGEQISQSDFDLDNLLSAVDSGEAPVIKLIQSIFKDAVQMGASDIHIEPDEHVLRIRQRVDGVLSEQIIPDNRVSQALATRLKLMSGLNIAEKRLPQDGRFSIKVENASLDVRVSTMPAQYGESVVMRLLNQSAGVMTIEELGMPSNIQSRFEPYIYLPHGMTLVTGPTGSGKSTTLYSALNQLNNSERKIITVEDPVEYRLPRITQVQVNEKIDLGFANVLRTILRQDPDVILIGEMRDTETAQIGIRSAMTGHQVLSTLHTNDAISTAPRLMDMGIDGYLVATAVRVILSQRLVRKICNNCISEVVPDPQQRAWIKSTTADSVYQMHISEGEGCHYCNNTGYRGRTGVYELLEFDSQMVDALRTENISQFNHVASRSEGYTPLIHNVMQYVMSGVTTLDEAQKIAGELEDMSFSHRTDKAAPGNDMHFNLAG